MTSILRKHAFDSTKKNSIQVTMLTALHFRLTSYLEDFNETAYKLVFIPSNDTGFEERVTKLAGNPLAVYRTLLRFENYIKMWATDDAKQEQQPTRDPLRPMAKIHEYLAKVYNPKDGPTYTDLEASIVGILRIQHVHDLESDQVNDHYSV